MAFPPMPAFARNDPFGPSGHNNILQRQDWLYDFTAVEHDPATGEHNTPHVPRALGTVAWNGAASVLQGFNSRVIGVENHAIGNVLVFLAANVFDADKAVLEVQPADDTGSTNAWLATAKMVNDQTVSVFLKKNTSGSAVQQTFAAADGSFFLGIRNKALGLSAPRSSAAARRSRGDGLVADANNWNPMVQALGTNRLATLAGHTSAGLHNAREVSKAWGYVKWDSVNNRYQLASHQGLAGGVAQIATGQIRIYLGSSAPPIIAPAQAFAQPISATVGDAVAHTGLRIAMVPVSTCGAASVDVFLYASNINVNLSSSPAIWTYRWVPVDGDFFVRVHGT